MTLPSRRSGHDRRHYSLLYRVQAGHSSETEDFALVGKLTAGSEGQKTISRIHWAEWWTNDGVIDAVDWEGVS